VYLAEAACYVKHYKFEVQPSWTSYVEDDDARGIEARAKPYPKPYTLARVEVISPCRGRFDLPGERFFSREYFKRCRLFWRQSTTRDGRGGTQRTGIARPVGTNEVEERASLDSSD